MLRGTSRWLVPSLRKEKRWRTLSSRNGLVDGSGNKDAQEQQDDKKGGFPGVTLNEVRPAQGHTQIYGLGDDGFFVNGKFIKGSMFCFPELIMSWNVEKDVEKLTVDHFAIADIVKPAVELIIVGTGPRTELLPPKLMDDLRKIAMVEVCSSFHACATYNLLAAEDRLVCAAIFSVPEAERID